MYINILWSSPLQIAIAIYMLYNYLGVAALIGVATMIFFIPVNLLLANRSKKLQTKKLKIQDSRIKMMNEILSGMKVLKFYGWEISFRNIVQNIRKQELDYLKRMGLLNVATSFTWICAPLIVSIISFSAFVLIDENNVLDASTAFVSLSLFNILRFPMTVLPGVISALINVKLITNGLRRKFVLKLKHPYLAKYLSNFSAFFRILYLSPAQVCPAYTLQGVRRTHLGPKSFYYKNK